MTKQGQAAIELHAIPILVLVKKTNTNREDHSMFWKPFAGQVKRLIYIYRYRATMIFVGQNLSPRP